MAFVTKTKEEFQAMLPDSATEVRIPGCKEIVWDIPSGVENLALRVYSTVDRLGHTRGKGEDAIRILHWDLLNNRPIGKGSKVLRTEGATTIQKRIQARLAEMLETCKGIEIKPKPTKNIWKSVDPDYVKAILESPIMSRNNFAQCLLENVTKYGSLTDGQLSYVLGNLNPKGRPAFEAEVKAKDEGFISRWLERPEVMSESKSKVDEGIDDENVEGYKRQWEIIPSNDGTNVKLVPTKDYPHFKYPYKNFNILQSLVYPHKAEDANLLVCGMTSSGKTVAAELLMDECFAQEKGKVLYMCPLRSLGSERKNDWDVRYSNRKIVELTGDTLYSQVEREKQMKLAAKADLIICTNELLDSLTRKAKIEKYTFLQEIGLIICDEAHLLAMENRGDITESTLMRFTHLNPRARILFLSATMSNLSELRDWCTTLNGKKSETVNCTWRPVVLQLHMTEFSPAKAANGREDYSGTQEIKENLAVDIAMSKPDKFLIFVHSKAQGRSIIRKLQKRGDESWFHNADLASKERSEIETSFKKRDGGLRVLVSSSTTAIGVNLPAKNVIIVGTTRGMNQVDILELTQECGRAGRPQYDKEGIVYFLVAEGTTNYWKNQLAEGRPIDSVMNERSVLAYHVLSEVQTREIRDVSGLFKWYRRSLAYRQGMAFEEADAAGLVRDLIAMKMIKPDASDKFFNITNLGRISSQMLYSPYVVYSWYKNGSSIFNPTETEGIKLDDYSLAWMIGHHQDSNWGYIPRSLEEDCQELRWKLGNRGIQDPGNTAPTILAIVSLLSGDEISGELAPIARTIKWDSPRILQSISMIDKLFSHWKQEELWQVLPDRLKYGIPSSMIELVKIPGVGAAKARKLFNNGIQTLEDVVREKAKMEMIFSPSTAKRIINAAERRISLN